MDNPPENEPERVACVALVEDAVGRLLTVHNKRYGGPSLPGGKREPGETDIMALIREVREEVGCEVLSYQLVFEGEHGIDNPDKTRASYVRLFRVRLRRGVEPTDVESGRSVEWMPRETFLRCSPFAAFYQRVFAAVPPVR